MRIVSSKKIEFLVNNIFERYYEPIQEELLSSGLEEEVAQKIKQEIVVMIYRTAMNEEIDTEEELDDMASTIINENLERVFVTYYAQKYVERFSLDKVALENSLLNRIQELKNEKTEEISLEKETNNTIVREYVPNDITIKTEVQEEKIEELEEIKETEETEEIEEIEEIKETEKFEEAEEIREEEIREAEEFKEVEETDNIIEEENKEELSPNTDFYDLEISINNERNAEPIVRRIEEPRIRRFQINWALTILLSLLVTIAIWVIAGMLMGRGYLPKVDLGYTWFNSHIWNIF